MPRLCERLQAEPQGGCSFLPELQTEGERLMPYAILRFKKCKAGGVGAAYAHNERKKETYKSNPDIDTTRKSENYHLVLPKQTYRREIQRIIQAADCKTRKDSTVMVETLITASPEFMNGLPPREQQEFFIRALSFVESKVGPDNIIAAVVHMDEKTPHMHLSFCPITEGKRGKTLSAKTILGNQATLSKWQTEYHAAMSERWPELERGISSLITKRKHIPVSVFKAADRLDRQFSEVVAALDGINMLNAQKKRDSAMKVLEQWMPEAIKFSVRIKEVDSYIKELEQAEKETRERISQAERKGDERVKSVQNVMWKTVDEKDKEILAAQRQAYEAADKLRRQANHIDHVVGRLPLEMRVRFHEEQQKVAALNAAKSINERGRAR